MAEIKASVTYDLEKNLNVRKAFWNGNREGELRG